VWDRRVQSVMRLAVCWMAGICISEETSPCPEWLWHPPKLLPQGQGMNLTTYLCSIPVPARISSFGGPVVRPFRNTASLACHAVGQPAPRREWLRGDQPLHAGSNHNVQIMDSGELVISNLQQSDSGNYTCQVANSHGSDHVQYTLTVQGKLTWKWLKVTVCGSQSTERETVI
jgi:hypothetical protein